MRRPRSPSGSQLLFSVSFDGLQIESLCERREHGLPHICDKVLQIYWHQLEVLLVLDSPVSCRFSFLLTP